MACCLRHFLWWAPGPAFTFLQSSGGITSFFRFLSPLTKQYGSYIIGTVPCERGGTGRRTGFRILRFMHKGSSPFARTIKRGGKRKARFPPLFCYIRISAPASECYRLAVVSTFQDAAHGFIIHLARVLRRAGIENRIVGDGVLLFQI